MDRQPREEPTIQLLIMQTAKIATLVYDNREQIYSFILEKIDGFNKWMQQKSNEGTHLWNKEQIFPTSTSKTPTMGIPSNLQKTLLQPEREDSSSPPSIWESQVSAEFHNESLHNNQSSSPRQENPFTSSGPGSSASDAELSSVKVMGFSSRQRLLVQSLLKRGILAPKGINDLIKKISAMITSYWKMADRWIQKLIVFSVIVVLVTWELSRKVFELNVKKLENMGVFQFPILAQALPRIKILFQTIDKWLFIIVITIVGLLSNLKIVANNSLQLLLDASNEEEEDKGKL
nr:PREDICTED: uncharacterized protein LOC106702832 [Latimeria chalumnae]XP_014341741.1 PREDICTED: uncharacterized protein LOC106702832 [Latimeria chalumnae]|eukprot:XP_014341740.1 PREDICTED: uncharacterized protein LOC106702832 [Latimeria chalumnae]